MISCSVRGKEKNRKSEDIYIRRFLVDARLVANGALEEPYAHHPIGFAYGLYLQHLLRSWLCFSQKLVFIWIFILEAAPIKQVASGEIAELLDSFACHQIKEEHKNLKGVS